MVKLAGTHEFNAPKKVVWEALLEPDVLSRILPGCKRLERIAENEFSGEISIRVGPVQGSFNGTVKLDDIDPPNGYRMELAGQGRPGFVKGAGTLRLDGDGPTTLRYDGDAQLSGRIASVGQRLVDSTARSLTRQGLQSLEQIIAARAQPPEPESAESVAAPPPAGGAPDPAAQPDIAAPPSTMEVGINVAKDVATDFAQEFQINTSALKVLYILAGFVAIVWMWRQLFGKNHSG